MAKERNKNEGIDVTWQLYQRSEVREAMVTVLLVFIFIILFDKSKIKQILQPIDHE